MYLFAGIFAFCHQDVDAQTKREKDSLKVVELQGVEVMSTRATSTTPVAFTNVSKKEIEQVNYGQDLPYIIGMTPSAITTSDAGAGIGYTTIRLRGTDATRINVTANGIPVNDAESHSVFWVNMGDFASSVKDIQIQRGAGTSTNGAGAFGASINMLTGETSSKPYAEFNGSYGSFFTNKETLKAGTGLLNDHWSFDARLSHIGSHGYIDRGRTSLDSYYLQGTYYAGSTSLKLINFTGEEQTYHAWNYASKDEMSQYGRRYNSCGYMFTDESGKVHYYDNQTDNYTQKNWQLLLNHAFCNQWKLNVGLHYTKGDGYYQEYKAKRTLSEYGLKPFEHNGETVEKSDLVRKKSMDNWFGGAVASINYTTSRINASIGGGYNHYDGDHFGNVIWVKNYMNDNTPDHRYYDNNAKKNDVNVYGKLNYQITDRLNAYGDLQFRHINYRINGLNDKYDWTGQGGMQMLDIDEKFDFLNPKAGLNWRFLNDMRLYASFSMSHKEPTRNNYTDGKFNEHPKSERLLDYEAGYEYVGKVFHGGVNFYYMDYDNQLVLTGELNEIGEALAANVSQSYRCGVELQAGIKLDCGFSWNANATFSRNRIKNFQETLYEEENNWQDQWVINHKSSRIAFSPDVIFNNVFGYAYKGLNASLSSQYVSRQYMNNANQRDLTIDPYFVSNLNVDYTFAFKKYLKSMTIGLTVYNLFNEKYENNGYAGGGFYYDDNHEKVRYGYCGYAAQAGTNLLAHISLKF